VREGSKARERSLVELLGEDEIAATVRRLAQELTESYPEGFVLVVVLRAAIFFAADLIRHLDVACRVDFLELSPYAPGTGRVRFVKDLDHDVCGEDVVLAECLVDTGLTCSYVMRQLEGREPRSLQVCTLLDRRSRRVVPVPLRFVGHEAPRDLLVGYGLEVAGRYRNLRSIFVADQRVVDFDPDAYVELLYGR
jgi:hypoxanthine phosphoribosyltransferase